ncbi:Uncharacterized protein ACO02O_02706 [Dirofilaria immitis]
MLVIHNGFRRIMYHHILKKNDWRSTPTQIMTMMLSLLLLYSYELSKSTENNADLALSNKDSYEIVFGNIFAIGEEQITSNHGAAIFNFGRNSSD